MPWREAWWKGVVFREAPIAVIGFGYPVPFAVASIAMAVLIALRHRDNIRRILTGDEPRVLRNKQAMP